MQLLSGKPSPEDKFNMNTSIGNGGSSLKDMLNITMDKDKPQRAALEEMADGSTVLMIDYNVPPSSEFYEPDYGRGRRGRPKKSKLEDKEFMIAVEPAGSSSFNNPSYE